MPEPKNAKNAYVCDLLHATVTLHKDEGTTPMFIDCPLCHKRSISRMGQVDSSLTPTYEWYKPNEDEIKNEAAEMAEKHGLTKALCFSSIVEHVNKGGLLMRKIN